MWTGISSSRVAVLLGAAPPASPWAVPGDALVASLEQDLGVPVDVVVVDDAPPDLVHRVLKDGVLLVERDRSARVRFEVYKRNEYFDLERVRRACRWPGRPA